MSARFDAIVIGGGIGGLVAAVYLKRAGRSVLLLEASDALGGACRRASTLYALDPRMVKELGLTARGLKFALRDMPLVGLRQDGRHLTLSRDPHQAARAITAHSPADAQAYKRYHTEIFALARALRPWWWEGSLSAPELGNAADRRLLAKLSVTSAAHFLSSHFETEALKAVLAVDVPAPAQPGSALTLVWRAAQEMCGLQGAVAMPQGGGAVFAQMLVGTTQDAGVEIRAQARVAKLILAGTAVAGVELDSGEQIFAHAVLSSLSRHETLLTLAPTASAGFAETQKLTRERKRNQETDFLFTLNAAPEFGPQGARFVVTEGEPALEAVVAALAPPGRHMLAVRAQGTPAADAVVAQLERYTPHLRGRIVGQEQHAQDVPATHLMDSAKARVSAPLQGLFLCGSDAEPVGAISGRAGRLAAEMAAREKSS